MAQFARQVALGFNSTVRAVIEDGGADLKTAFQASSPRDLIISVYALEINGFHLGFHKKLQMPFLAATEKSDDKLMTVLRQFMDMKKWSPLPS
ncbi:unnamed protein product [Calypogeia fissa]